MKFRISNKGWIVLSTAIFIGIAFSVYFLVYVKGKEKAIISNNFRVLQQVVQNIKSLELSFHNNAIIKSKSIHSQEVNQKLDTLNDKQCDELKLLITQNKGVIYGEDGIYFDGESENHGHSHTCDFQHRFYFTAYEVFFSNDLFQRKDVFDQIIITKVNERDSVEAANRSVLFSNAPIGIMDSAFYMNTLRNAKDEITINENEFVSFNQKIDDKSDIYISGLILKSKYEQQKRSVSPFVIFTMSIALMLIILAMPLLKLKIMSREERLYIRDVMFSVVSVLIGPAVFMIFLFTSLAFFGNEKDKLNDNLVELSKKLEYNFQKELHQLINQIDDLNVKFPAVKDSSQLKDKVFSLAKDSGLSEKFNEYKQGSSNQYKIKGYRVFEDVIQKDTIDFKHLKAAFWCDSAARIMVLLSAFHEPGYGQDLSHRKYLTNILNKAPNIFKDLSGNNNEIAIESIKSVTDGSYEVGVGKSSGGIELPVTAISTKLASVMGNVLEEGYGFCILDRNGNTMFHSDIKKNMNENFISETKGLFRHSMISHSEAFKTMDYNGKSQTIYFRPLNCLSDHYLATFINSEVYYGPFTLSLITSFVLFICYLLILLFVFLGMYYSTFKGTKLKQTVYMLNFLRPYETEGHFKKYKRLIFVSSIVALYLIASSIVNRIHYDFLISDLVIVSVSLLIFSFYSLSKHLPEHKLMHTSFQNRTNRGFKIIAFLVVLLLAARIWFYYAAGYSPTVTWNSAVGFLAVLLIIIEIFTDKKIFKVDNVE